MYLFYYRWEKMLKDVLASEQRRLACQSMTSCSHVQNFLKCSKSPKATPIYLLVLRAQEVGNEPFWNKKKVEKCVFLIFLESAD